jgi:ribosomal protein L7/L12
MKKPKPKTTRKLKTPKDPPVMIHMGLTAGAARELAEAVKAIVQMKGNQQAKIAAIKALKEIVAVQGATISNCYFGSGGAT